MRLSHNEIVSVGEEVECILKEVDGTAINCGFHAEKRDSEGILSLLRRVRNGCQVIDLLTEGLDCGIGAVLAMCFNVREKL